MDFTKVVGRRKFLTNAALTGAAIALAPKLGATELVSGPMAMKPRALDSLANAPAQLTSPFEMPPREVDFQKVVNVVNAASGIYPPCKLDF